MRICFLNRLIFVKLCTYGVCFLSDEYCNIIYVVKKLLTSCTCSSSWELAHNKNVFSSGQHDAAIVNKTQSLL